MKVIPIIQNNNSKSKNNKQTFGNFIKLELPESMVPNVSFFTISSKKIAKSSLTAIEKIAKNIKAISGEVNIYRRSLDDMNFVTKWGGNGIHDRFARTIFIEDNGGVNKPDFLKVIDHLIENKLSFDVYSADLFTPSSNLETVAYNAKPKQMIKM